MLTPAGAETAETSEAHSLAEKFSQAAKDAERKAAEAQRREEARKKAEAAAAEAARRAEEKRKAAAEAKRKAVAEAKRKAAAEAKRLAEAQRKAAAERAAYEEEMLRRARAEAEERRAKEAEATRLAAERAAAERRRLAEAQRRAKEVEQKRLAAERAAAEKRRLAEAQRRAREAEAKRVAAQRKAEKRRRLAEAARRAKQAEAKRLAEQDRAREAKRQRQAQLEAQREAEVRRVIEQFRIAREARRRSLPPRDSLGGPEPLIAKTPPVREKNIVAAPQPPQDPGRVTVLLVMEPRRRGSSRKRGDPVLCIGKGCYISAGANTAANYFPRWKAMGPGIALGRRAGACRHKLNCVFRDVDFGAETARIQPVDLGYLRHSRRRVKQARTDGSCTVANGRLHCAQTVVADTYRAWIVPEAIARKAGPAVLKEALEAGLPASQSAALSDW